MRNDEPAKIIDRLLCLMPDRNYNATDLALRWLIENDHPKLVLSLSTRVEMENFAKAEGLELC